MQQQGQICKHLCRRDINHMQPASPLCKNTIIIPGVVGLAEVFLKQIQGPIEMFRLDFGTAKRAKIHQI